VTGPFGINIFRTDRGACLAMTLTDFARAKFKTAA